MQYPDFDHCIVINQKCVYYEYMNILVLQNIWLGYMVGPNPET